mgnify:CR=1 FL=1
MSRFRPSRNYVSGKVVFDSNPVEITGNVFISGVLSASSIVGGGGGSTTPGGANTNVQYNNAGAFGGSTNFVWNNAASTLQITGDISGSGNVSGSSFYGDGANLTNLPAGSPGGADTQIQFNDGGVFNGDTEFTWNKTSNTLTVTGDISGSGNISGSAFYGDGSNLTNISATIPSGTIGRVDSTGAETFYLTISGAVAASTSGDYVRVGPGTYIEDSPINIPAGISVIGEAGWQVTEVSSSTGLGDLFVLGDGSMLKDFKIAIPSDTGSYGAKFSGSAGQVASANFLSFYGGSGLRGSGYGNQGLGKTIGLEIRYSTGDCDAVLAVEDGILAVEGVHIPNSAGAVDAGMRANSPSATRVGNRGRLQGIDINMGATNVEDGIVAGSTSTVVLQGINLFNIQNTFHLTSNSASLLVTSGLSDPAVNDLKVDTGLTGDASLTRINAFMNGVFDIPYTWIPSDHAWTFFTSRTATSEASSNLFGAKQVLGHPELGSGFSAGEGANYSTNNTVFTTDGTLDSPTNNGTGFVDVSVAASSLAGSTFSFQGVTAGHSIMWCTKRVDSSNTTLKHWGIEIDQVAAAVIGTGNFIIEYQSAANVWTEIGSMAVASEEQHRYANNLFLRANSEERLYAGIHDFVSWAPTTINGVLGRWMRCRIEATVTTAPTFERFRLMPSHTNINKRGSRFATGLAMWKSKIALAPQLGGGMLTDADYTVGSGGNISFTHSDAVLDTAGGNGSVAGAILEIPSGLCTAFPLRVKVIYNFETASTATSFDFKHYVAQTQGILIADPSGAITPIVRTEAATELWTTNTAVIDAETTPAGVLNKLFILRKATDADISANYEGDFLFIEMDITTMNSELAIISLELEGVSFNTGGPHD